MPTALSRSVREHMGEKVADDFSRWFTENVQQELVTNDEYREVLFRLDVLEERFSHVEDRFEGMDTKLDRMSDRILSMTRWITGPIALFGTMVTVLLAIAQFGS